MNDVSTAIRAAGGVARSVPVPELWSTAGLLADTLPLDRRPRYARPARQFGHYVRLVLWDRALTNDDATAVMVVGQPPWLAAGAAAVTAAVVAPKVPRWLRRAALAALVVTAVQRSGRVRDELAVQRLLQDVAPGAILIEHLATRTPNAALAWVTDLFDTLDRAGHRATFVALLPGARRDKVRERIYTRRWGFEVAARTQHHGSELTVLVRHTGRT